MKSSDSDTSHQPRSNVSSTGSDSEHETPAKNETKPTNSRSTVLNKIEFLYRILIMPVRALLCFCNVTVFFVTYFGFMITVLWAKKVWPRFYWFYEGKLYMWLQAFIAYWGYTANYVVYEYGDNIRSHGERDRVLLICNHQSTADVPVLFSILQHKGVAARKTVWLMDIMFKWTPFGLIGRMHGDYFIQQGKSTRGTELDKLERHLEKIFWERDRRWVILFPEGGFYHNRVKGSQEYARKNGFPHLEHITLPRMGAVKTILKTVGPKKSKQEIENRKQGSRLKINFKAFKDKFDAIRKNKHLKDTRPPIKWILDVTVAYPDGKPLQIENLMLGNKEKCNIAVNYRVFPVEEIPFDDDTQLRDWMYKVYEENDKLLAYYYKHGTFKEGERGRRVKFSWSTIIGQYAFWFMSFAVQIKFYYYLLSSLYQLVFSFVS